MAKQWSPNNQVAATGPAIPESTLAQEEAGQSNLTGSHVGTCTADFQFCFQPPGGSGTILNFRMGQYLTADAALYAAMGGASPIFPITWND